MQFIPQILIIFLGPLILLKFFKDSKLGKVLSPVVLSYALGISMATFHLIPLNFEISKSVSELSIMLAIPLLLFSANIVAWFRHAKSTVLSFFFAIVAAVLSCVILGFLFNSRIEHIADFSGMLTGVYTGGTANMQAVGIAIKTPENSFALINSLEIICGGLYLLFLTSFAPSIFGKLLPKYKASGAENDIEEQIITLKHWKYILTAVGLSIAILGLTMGAAYLLYGGLTNTTFIILVLTTLSVIASFSPKIRGLTGSFEAGDYLLLVFCVAVGMRSDFGDIWDQGSILMVYTALTWIVAVLIHLGLSMLAKIDRDTTLITSTAALYGPAFIGQIASVLKNREVVFAGIATGLIGYAVGNYLGIGVYYFLEAWLK